MPIEKDALRRLIRNLKAHGLVVEERRVVGTSAPDLVVTSPIGTSAIVEAKEWDSSAASLQRASRLADLYSAASGSFSAFTLLPYVPPSSSAPNVISPDNFAPLMDRLSRRPSKLARKPRTRDAPKTAARVFVAMPFGAKFDKPFEMAVKPAAVSVGLECIRIDKEFYAGDVVAAIKAAIRSCAIVVADLSAANPNVLFEAGYAEASGKPVVQICATSLKKLPFDVRNNNTIRYSASNLDVLRRKIAKTLKRSLA